MNHDRLYRATANEVADRAKELAAGFTPEARVDFLYDVSEQIREAAEREKGDIRSTRAVLAVQKGAAYLDQTYPGWRDRMLERWHISSAVTCPLSTATEGNYHDAPEQERGIDWLESHGFSPALGYGLEPGSRELQTAWEAELS